LIPHAGKIIFDHCGHFIAIDKAEENAESIVNLFDLYYNDKEKQLSVLEFE